MKTRFRISHPAARTKCALVFLAILTLAGCGPNVKVSGRLTRSGQPVNGTEEQHIQLTFYPMSDAGSSSKKSSGPDLYGANIASDGSYDVPGVDGDGIPPGKYRVAVALTPGRDRSTDPKKRKNNPDRDFFNGVYGPDNSPIIREITASGTLNIDLDKLAD